MSLIYDAEETPISGTMLLEASAGTGKTYALERMVARLVGREKNPLKIGQILVVTFTNRAAREMRERIRRLLSKRMREETRGELERERYRMALGEFDRAPIYTIHGFCQMVLSTWPFESGAPFRQDLEPGGMLEREETRRWLASPAPRKIDTSLFQAAYNQAGGGEALLESLSRKLLDSSIPPGAVVLPDESELHQMRTLVNETNRGEGNLLSALAALSTADWSDSSIDGLLKGSGAYSRSKGVKIHDKIRAHVAALSNLVVQSGVAGNVPETGAAAGVAGQKSVESTLFSEILDAVFGDPAGVQVNKHFLNVLSVAASRCTGTLDGAESLAGPSVNLAEALNRVYLALSPVVELLPSGKEMENHSEPYMQCEFEDIALKEIRGRLEKRKDESGRWGYDDLIRRVAGKVVEEAAHAAAATAKETFLTSNTGSLTGLLRSRYKAALIDEFQDTDPMQWQLFKTLFGGSGSVLVLIGDPKQSIYGFRGVGLQAYKQARAGVPDETSYRLDTNYRSRPQLVESANRLFTNVFQFSSDGSEAVGFEPAGSGRSKYCSLRWPQGELPVGILTPLPVEGEKTREAMARSIVAEIRAILDPNKGAQWQSHEGDIFPVEASDIAVLVRSRKDEENLLGRLHRLGIPAIRYRSDSVFRQAAAEALRTLLEAFESPRRTSFWRKLLLETFFRVPPSLVEEFEQTGKLDQLAERGEVWKKDFEEGLSTAALEDFFDYSAVLGEWAAEAGFPIEAQRLKVSWPQRVLSEPDGERQWQDWRQLVELVQEKQSEGVFDLGRIRNWMLEQAETADMDGGPNAIRLETERPSVRVLTLHSAKGLEFPLVFLHGGYQTSAPGNQAQYRFESAGRLYVDRVKKAANLEKNQCYEWEEEKRLWYVGFTRASTKLWLCRPSHDAPIQIDSLFDDALNPVSRDSNRQSLRPPLHLRIRGTAEKAAAVSETDKRIERFFSENPRLFHFTPGRVESALPLPLPIPEEPVLSPLPADFPADRDPRTASYSSLIREALQGTADTDPRHDRDVDSENVAPAPVAAGTTLTDTTPAELEPLPLASDRGALFGTLMHAILEEIDFSVAVELSEDEWLTNKDLGALFEGITRRYYPPDWYRPRAAAIKSMIRNTLRAPLGELGRLCDLEKSTHRAEVEFLLAVPRSARLKFGELESRLHHGYLKGFIDLLVHHENRWWVLDWKTNVPFAAVSAADYRAERLEEMMESHHYHLQYQLYLLSLARTLSANSGKAVDWEADIGGAAYLFLRGMREGDPRGVYLAKPSLESMRRLSSDMGLQGVIA